MSEIVVLLEDDGNGRPLLLYALLLFTLIVGPEILGARDETKIWGPYYKDHNIINKYYVCKKYVDNST